MQDFMRKHKRTILVFTLLVIIVPFVFFFGNPSTGYKSRSEMMEGNTQNIGSVGGVPITVAQFRQALDAATQRMSQRGQDRLTYQELDKSGQADKVLEQLVDSALISVKEKERSFDVEDSLAAEQMKKWNIFQDENGKFNAEAWNEWVKQSTAQDWNAIYKDQKTSIARQTFLDTIMAPAGEVLDSEIQKQLEENSTKIQIKYAKIEPKVEVTDEEIQKHYEGNPESYKTPDTRAVEYVTISLVPPVPQKALDVVKQAREGADFAKLADDNSDLQQKNGGDMGWQTERENDPDFRKVLFTTKVGEVTDPVLAFNSYYVYKIEEERINSDTQKREVRARQIMIKAELPADERKARDAQALAIQEKVLAGADFKTAADEAKLEVKRTGQFTKESEDIEGFPKADVRSFRMAFENKSDEKPVKVVTGRSGIYVAKVVELIPGVVQPLDAVKDKAREDTIAAKKKTDEYKAKVAEYAEKIKAQAKSLAQINELFPELGAEVKETSEFTRKDYLFKEQVYLQTTEIFEAVARKEPGAMGGPLKDFQGNTFFVELVKKTPPTEEDKKKWDEEKKQLRDSARMAAQNALIEDYLADLRERTLPNLRFTTDQKLIDEILGRNQKPEGDQPAEGEKKAGEPGALPAQPAVEHPLKSLADE